MGKGDKKSKRGKIWIGSYGVSRPRRKSTVLAKPVVNEKPPKKEKKAPVVEEVGEVKKAVVQTELFENPVEQAVVSEVVTPVPAVEPLATEEPLVSLEEDKKSKKAPEPKAKKTTEKPKAEKPAVEKKKAEKPAEEKKKAEKPADEKPKAKKPAKK